MSDDTSNSDPNPESDSTPESQADAGQRQVPYRIESQYVKDFSFESPRAPDVFFNAKHAEAKIDVAVDVETKTIGPRIVEVTLMVEAKASTDEGVVYVIELAYAGAVAIGPVPKEAIPPLLLIEVPRMLFPFARNMVAELSRNGGFNTLFLAPFDFLGLFEAKMANQQEEGEPAVSDVE